VSGQHNCKSSCWWGCSPSRVWLKTQFSPAAVSPSMDDFLVEDSAVDGLPPWCLATFSSGSLSRDFICLLVTSRAVIDIPIEVASRVVVTPSQRSRERSCLLSLYQNGCYSQQSRIYFPTQWLIGSISRYFHPTFPSICLQSGCCGSIAC
jgi:hypothetical protein